MHAGVHARSPAAEKIALFRSLFRGREDVYPRRFESRKTGRSGYAPACGNEWVRGICEKPRIKCANCPHRAFLPVTDDVIRQHLSGKDTTGQDFVAGLFQLNTELPIPFDRWSEIEIDLYCPKLKLAIEIDGPQHLADPAAYRSDRRKDALLQENHIFVLRFLAEDLGKQLDLTLDAILRTLTQLQNRKS